MTIDITDNNPRINYSVAEGVTQTVFAVPFEFFEDSDVHIYVDGVLKLEATDYTLTGGDGSVGTLTFVTAEVGEVQQVNGIVGGSTVAIVRHVSLERVTDFVAGQDINRASLNEQLDTITAQIADLDDKVDRTVRLSDSEIAPSMLLTSDRKGRLLAFDSVTGDVEAGPLADSITPVNATTVTAAGALMDSEVTNLAQVKAFDDADYATATQGYKADLALRIPNNFTDISSPRLCRINLGVDIGADVQAYSTILANTTASYTTAESGKLSGIEVGADATDTTNVVASLTAGTNVTIAADGTIAASLSSGGDGDLIAANNLSDLDNAGTGRTNLGVAIGSDVQAYASVLANTTASFLLADETKLDGIEAGADVTDTSNVVASLTAGTNVTIAVDGTIAATDTNTVYTHPANHAISVITGLQTALDDKVDDSQVLTNVPSGALFTDTVYDDTAIQAAVSLNTAKVTNVDHPLVETAVPTGAVFTDTNTTYSVGDGGLTQINFTSADNTKLDAIEASADVTDTANVVAALTAGANVAIASNGTISATDTDTVYTHPANHAISVITGLQTALDGKVDDSQVLTNVPSGALFTDTAYDDTSIQAAVSLNTAKVTNVSHPLVETAVPVGAVFTDTDTVYTHPANHPISVITGLQTALDGKVDDSQVLTNVPSGALFTDTDTDTVYTHPSGDGNLHVPATSTTNSGKVLTAGSTAGALTWETASGGGTALELYAENPAATAVTPVATGQNGVAIGDGATASGAAAFGIGLQASASGSFSVAIGRLASATTSYGVALGYNSDADGSSSNSIGLNTTASSSYSTSLGAGSAGSGATTATGSGAMALGGSYASGTNSFAAAIDNNTSSYGATGDNSVAIGLQAKATTYGSLALGRFAGSTANYSIAIGYRTVASGVGSVAIGNQYYLGTPTASGSASIAIGDEAKATQKFSTALGASSSSVIVGKYAYAGGEISGHGDSQTGTLVLRKGTSDATATALTSNNSTAGTTNQVILPNNSAFAFSGTIVARQQASGGTASAAWEIKGLIRREGSAGTTVLVNSATTVLDNTPAWGMALTADTTNGGLAITVTGAASTNIRWVATINTSEVTY